MERLIENNQAALSGEIIGEFEFSHEVFGEKFYVTHMKINRFSGVSDIIPIMASDRLIPIEESWAGQFVSVIGQFRSYTKHDDDKNRLILSVFARECEPVEVEEGGSSYKNRIDIDGFLCKNPIYRKTPLNREIADLLIAVNRPYWKADYIPCICWGRNARYASRLDVGTHVKISGRIQSRTYKKKISETESEKRTAYEVSVSKIEETGEFE